MSKKAMFIKAQLYFIAAGTGAIFGFFTRRITSPYIGFASALIVAYFVGLFVNYGMSRKLVFKSKDPQVLREFLRFFFSSLGGLAIQFSSALGLHWLLTNFYTVENMIAEDISHVLSLGFSFVGNFALHHVITFKNKLV